MLETSKLVWEARKSQGIVSWRFLIGFFEWFFDTTSAGYRYRLKFYKYYDDKKISLVSVAWQYQISDINTHHQETTPGDFGCSGMVQTRSAAPNPLSWVGFPQNSSSYFQFFESSFVLGKIATSSHDHWIRLRILHRYSWTDFFWGQNSLLGAVYKSAHPSS